MLKILPMFWLRIYFLGEIFGEIGVFSKKIAHCTESHRKVKTKHQKQQKKFPLEKISIENVEKKLRFFNCEISFLWGNFRWNGLSVQWPTFQKNAHCTESPLHRKVKKWAKKVRKFLVKKISTQNFFKKFSVKWSSGAMGFRCNGLSVQWPSVQWAFGEMGFGEMGFGAMIFGAMGCTP